MNPPQFIESSWLHCRCRWCRWRFSPCRAVPCRDWTWEFTNTQLWLYFTRYSTLHGCSTIAAALRSQYKTYILKTQQYVTYQYTQPRHRRGPWSHGRTSKVNQTHGWGWPRPRPCFKSHLYPSHLRLCRGSRHSHERGPKACVRIPRALAIEMELCGGSVELWTSARCQSILYMPQCLYVLYTCVHGPVLSSCVVLLAFACEKKFLIWWFWCF